MTLGGRFLSRLVTMLVALVGLVVVGAVPAVAESNSRTVQYVALGDSYAAGQGGGDYLNKCLESPNGYPYLLDAEKRIHLRTNVACTGASTEEVAKTQLSALNRGTRLVTLTVGAADLNLSQVLAACSPVPTNDCQGAIMNAIALLPDLRDSLTELYASVAAEAPNALIVVTGYPYLFDVAPNCAQNASIMERVNCATLLLNSTIQQAVAEQDSDVDIEYVDVTGAFSGHGIGSAVPFINPPQAGLPAAFHPNAAGYVAYAEAISEVVLQSA
jgi:lysophospholipase L1-like esterase